MRWLYAAVLAILIHVLLLTLSNFPSVERRVAIDDPDLVISLRHERVPDWGCEVPDFFDPSRVSRPEVEETRLFTGVSWPGGTPHSEPVDGG